MTSKSDTLQIGSVAAGTNPQVLDRSFRYGPLTTPSLTVKAPPNFFEWQQQGKPICVVTKEGRVTKDDVDITDNDKAMAECFVDYLKKIHNVEVKRDS